MWGKTIILTVILAGVGISLFAYLFITRCTVLGCN